MKNFLLLFILIFSSTSVIGQAISIRYITAKKGENSQLREALQTKINPQEIFNYVEKIKNNLFDFNYLEFIKSYENLLHLNGNLVDVIIHNNDMEKFLDIHKEKFDNLALEYIKKMKTYEQSNSI